MSSGPNPSCHGNQTVNTCSASEKVSQDQIQPLMSKRSLSSIRHTQTFQCKWYKWADVLFQLLLNTQPWKQVDLMTKGLVIAFLLFFFFFFLRRPCVSECRRCINNHMLNLLWTILQFNLSTGKGKMVCKNWKRLNSAKLKSGGRRITAQMGNNTGTWNKLEVKCHGRCQGIIKGKKK